MSITDSGRRISDTENRLCILFSLHELGMATTQQLWSFVGENTCMDYVTFCLLLGELRADGNVTYGSGALENVLFVTFSGAGTLELFLHRIPHTTREKLHESASSFIAQLETQRQISAVSIHSGLKAYGAEVTVKEADIPTLMIRIHADESAVCRSVIHSFASKAAYLMTMLYTLPPEQPAKELQTVFSAEDAFNRVSAGKPVICSFGGPETAAVVSAESGETVVQILLLFPDRPIASGWAYSADQAGEALCGRILEALTAGEEES